MMRLKVNKLLILAGLSIGVMMQGCAAGKSCGCGNDINKTYRQPKRFP